MDAFADSLSLELYFIEGRSDGILTAEVFNWTGHVLMTPRTRIGIALQRKEARHTGVYLLLGEKDDNPQAYIGEGEDIAASATTIPRRTGGRRRYSSRLLPIISIRLTLSIRGPLH